MRKRYWLVRNSPSVAVGPSGGSFSISSRRVPTISQGDAVVLMTGSKTEDASFKAFGSIASIKTGAKPNERGYLTEVTIADVSEGSSLDIGFRSAMYSLEFVKDASRPQAYLNRGYRVMSRDDFETITKGNLYVARTGYFLLLTSLPISSQRNFLSSRVSAGHDTSDYYLMLISLLEFIEERVFAAGSLLLGIREQLFQLRQTSAQFPTEHLIIDEEAPALRADSITQQTEAFLQLKKALSDSSQAWREAVRPPRDSEAGSQMQEFTRLLMPQIQDDAKQAARFKGKQ